MTLVQFDAQVAKEKFLKEAFTLKHQLADHALFQLPYLVELAQSLPRDKIEYNAGKLAVDVRPEDIPTLDMPAAEVIKNIETAGAWMVIKSVELHPGYAEILRQFVEEANRAAGKNSGDYMDLQGFIFVSSANTTTPFHIDMEENILIQIKGDKIVHTFDNRDCKLVSEFDMEIAPSTHRNKPYANWYENHATIHNLKPGDGVHMPYTTPHWVGTTDSYSISMAMTWKTPEVLRLNKIRLMNGTLRRYGLPQKPPGASPMADKIKVIAHDIAQATLGPIRRSELGRRIIRGLIYGRKANYYLENQKQKTAM